MLITIVDVETTGLDPATDEVIEVGAVLYSVEHRAIVQQVSTLLPVTSNPAEDVNGISVGLANLVIPKVATRYSPIKEMLSNSAYATAFNSDFDRQWFDGSLLPAVPIPWSDAAAIRYPKPSNSRSLIALCVAHGIPVVSAHRALDDCRLLAALLGTVDDLEGELARASRPKVLAKRMPLEDAEGLPFAVEVVA